MVGIRMYENIFVNLQPNKPTANENSASWATDHGSWDLKQSEAVQMR